MISAKLGELGDLRERLVEKAALPSSEATMITSARHYEALSRGLDAIRRVKRGLAEGVSGEFLSMDLEECLEALGEVTGKITSQEVLNNIFSKFCIGK